MDKSQLRLLAQMHARAEIDEDEYLRRRSELIAAITAGETPIEREAHRPPSPPAAPVEPEPSGIRISRLPYSALHLVVGVIVVVAVIGFVVPSSEPPVETAPSMISPPAPATPVEATSPPPRELVDRFLDRADWSTPSIELFTSAWDALPEPGRAEALSSPWFRRLITALRQEINAQKALVSLDRSGDAAEIGLRLVAFGRHLGIASELPEFQVPAPAPPVVATRSPRPAVAAPAPPAAAPSPSASARASQPPATASTAASRVTAREPGDGNRWLVDQDNDRYTLQLFAVGRLDKVKQLVAAHPALPLHVLSYADSSPKYRIVYGQFRTPADAEAAYASLPTDLTRGGAKPLVKLIKDLRARASVSGGEAASRGESRPQTWLGRQPGGFFTLQLFASDQPDNVRRLVDRFPELELKIHHSTDARSRFRVLHGAFPNAEAARAAVKTLPPKILQEAGSPLVRSIADLQAITEPTSD